MQGKSAQLSKTHRASSIIRWGFVAVWAAITFSSATLTDFLSVLGFALLIGVSMEIIVRRKSMGDEQRARFLSVLRGFEIAAVTCGAAFFPKDFPNLWILACPALLGEGMASRNLRRALFASAFALGMLGAGALQQDRFQQYAVPMGYVGASALIGVWMAQYGAMRSRLIARDRSLLTIQNTASNVAAASDLRTLVLKAVKDLVEQFSATAGVVVLSDVDDKSTLYTEAIFSRKGPFNFPESLKLGQGISGYVAQSGQPTTLVAKPGAELNLEDIQVPVQSVVSVPLISREFSSGGVSATDEVVGAITIVDAESNTPRDPDELDLLQSLSALLANAVHNARMEQRQRATFLRTLESLAKSLEARDDYTRGHSQRVCEVSMHLGSRLGLLPDALEELRIGTILHDIGKIGVPDAILNKPGRLTDEEFRQMKQHPVIGYEICQPLQLTDGILMIIRNHHEKLDGSGYPDGLKGGELPLSLRIVCVADAFDAMSSRRPYRGVMDMNRVMSELSRGAGVQFDPVVVEALKSLLHESKLDYLYSEYWDGGFNEIIQAKPVEAEAA